MNKGSAAQRVELSEEELEAAFPSQPTEEKEVEPHIPILKRLQEGKKTPTCVIVVGMAGSGKV